jgi:hypothetical protein
VLVTIPASPIAARRRGGNQAGAGNFLPAVFNTTAIANFPTQQDHQRDQLRSQLADGLRRHPHPAIVPRGHAPVAVRLDGERVTELAGPNSVAQIYER